ncbi:hypothetical protein BH11ARM2_BH11ARM2_16030 [soil metagenome]
MPSPPFRHDVFLSHSSKDKPVVRAERLRSDGIHRWRTKLLSPKP